MSNFELLPKKKQGRPFGTKMKNQADKKNINVTFGVSEKLYYEIKAFKKLNKKPFANYLLLEINKLNDNEK